MAERLREAAKGVYIFAATRFREDGALGLDGFPRLIDFYLGHGVHGITILGMMGEANKLTAAETERFARGVLAYVNGRVPVVVGVSTSALVDLAALSKTVMAAGAAGVMVAPTPGLKGDDQLVAYMETVAAALGPDIPLVYQDYPQSTGVFLPVAVWHRLVAALPSLVMLKHEDCPALAKLSRIRADEKQPGRRRVSILVGNGGLYYPQELQRGADGAMTGFAFPEMLVGVYDRHRAGDAQAAEDLFDCYLPFVRYEQQPVYGLAVRKEVLRRRGAIASAKARYPAPTLTGDDLAEIDRLLARLARRLAAQ